MGTNGVSLDANFSLHNSKFLRKEQKKSYKKINRAVSYIEKHQAPTVNAKLINEQLGIGKAKSYNQVQTYAKEYEKLLFANDVKNPEKVIDYVKKHQAPTVNAQLINEQLGIGKAKSYNQVQTYAKEYEKLLAEREHIQSNISNNSKNSLLPVKYETPKVENKALIKVESKVKESKLNKLFSRIKGLKGKGKTAGLILGGVALLGTIGGLLFGGNKNEDKVIEKLKAPNDNKIAEKIDSLLKEKSEKADSTSVNKIIPKIEQDSVENKEHTEVAEEVKDETSAVVNEADKEPVEQEDKKVQTVPVAEKTNNNVKTEVKQTEVKSVAVPKAPLPSKAEAPAKDAETATPKDEIRNKLQESKAEAKELRRQLRTLRKQERIEFRLEKLAEFEEQRAEKLAKRLEKRAERQAKKVELYTNTDQARAERYKQKLEIREKRQKARQEIHEIRQKTRKEILEYKLSLTA